MEWNAEQLAELARQYARVGYVSGELWPAPPAELTPDQLLDMFRRISDNAGRDGWLGALADIAPHREGPTNRPSS